MTQSADRKDQRVAIIGAGLAGSLLAVVMAKQGYKVDVYESRHDSRADNASWGGRSINLALSARGRKALRKAGIEEKVVANCIPMKGRIMHDVSGKLSFMPYGVGDQVVLSAGRRMLNEELMNAAESHPNVTFHFEATCKKVNLRDTSFNHIDQKTNKVTKIEPDYIFGADGSNSIVRNALQQQKGVDFHQAYLPHGYKELTIPPVNGNFAMDPHALHIWPRGNFMMIALPNPDKSFTVTLFMPWEKFDELTDVPKMHEFFVTTFPDSIPLIPDLDNEYFQNPTGYLIQIQCSPWYHNHSVILGDAAHAIVPFYGQGMNASLEDVDVLDDLLSQGGDLLQVFPEFFKLRKPAGDAISLLSRNNYIEMRSHVASSSFLWRKSLEQVLHKYFPEKFIPLYTMVAFTSIPYDEVVRRDQRQNKLLDRILSLVPITTVALATLGALAIPQTRKIIFQAIHSVFSPNSSRL